MRVDELDDPNPGQGVPIMRRVERVPEREMPCGGHSYWRRTGMRHMGHFWLVPIDLVMKYVPTLCQTKTGLPRIIDYFIVVIVTLFLLLLLHG